MIKGKHSKMTIEEIKKDIKKYGLKNKIRIVLLLNNGEYMASSDKNSIEVKIAYNKYNAIDISELILA
jgi:ribonucleotide reductase alpha subunit